LAFVDTFGRVHDDLRISITDRCNLRCAYCMPEEPEWFPAKAILSYEEITRLAAVAIAEGVRTLRVTGGEPLVRREVDRLFRSLAALPGLKDLSLTTNGVLLEPLAKELARAGLRRINVSLDTLDRARFAKLTGRDRLPEVLRGLDAAAAAGLGPIKINAVLLRGENEENEAVELVRYGRDHGFEVRFIEFMPLENDHSWDLSRVVSGTEVRRSIAAHWPLIPDPGADPHAPASRFLFEDGRSAVGFIDSVTAPFCRSCSRLRVTSDGKFRVCLYDDKETDLRAALRGGQTDAAIAALMRAAVIGKGRGGALDILESKRPIALTRTMHQIGG
jgi:cyclic pyranopterin phosphate synthase